MALINIENLKYRYPGYEQLALDDISLTIERGEFIGICGRNGAGKSTLSQAIIGLVPQFYKGAYGGRVEVGGILAEKKPVYEMCEKVGLIFQNPFTQLTGARDTVYGEIAFGLQNLAIERDEMHRRIETVMKQLDIWEYKDRNPFDLSGGQMQRVAIASVLVMQPEIIILDEPTSQLDPQGSEEVFRVVEQLADSGITVIMIEQKVEKLAAYCDRIILMDGGKMVAFDTAEKIYSRDDLEELGIEPPVYTRLAKQYGVKDENGNYPAKLEDAVRLFAEKKIEFEKPVAEAPVAEAEKVFNIEDLDFAYVEGVDILKDFCLKLDRRSTAIIGQNGAGKTTLVRLLKGLLKPASGSIYYGGEDISGKTVAMLADKVGYVFQNPDDQIFKHNVLEELMFGPMNIGMSEADAKAEALKALKLMGLEGKENMNPYDLDLHERKMVAIASVLAMDTDVLILDEPTIAQDYSGRKIIGDMIRKLTDEGRLVIAVLHDMDFVEEYFDRVIVMAHGELLCEGSAAEVYSQAELLEEAKLQKPHRMQLYDLLKA